MLGERVVVAEEGLPSPLVDETGIVMLSARASVPVVELERDMVVLVAGWPWPWTAACP